MMFFGRDGEIYNSDTIARIYIDRRPVSGEYDVKAETTNRRVFTLYTYSDEVLAKKKLKELRRLLNGNGESV